jgi:hypothetical protein
MDLKLTEAQAVQVLRELGISPGAFQTVRACRTLKEATRKLAALKATAKRGYRDAAFRLHPDRNPDDPEKEELFKLVTRVHTQIQELKVRPPAPPRPRVVMHWPSTTVTTSTSSTTTTLGSNGIRVTVRVKV